MSDGEKQPEDSAALLAEARTAWRRLQSAQASMARLRSKYTRMTAAMGADHDRAVNTAEESRRTLNRILGGIEE